MSLNRTMTVVATALALAGCGGSSSTVSPETMVVAEPDPLAELYKVTAVGDVFVMTKWHSSENPTGTTLACGISWCGANGRVVLDSNYLARVLYEIEDLDAELGANGITMASAGAENLNIFGGWSEHVAFAAYNLRVQGVDPEEAEYFMFATALGNLGDTALPVEGTASWDGTMSGVDLVTTDLYRGDARVEATFSEASTVDVWFTNIVNRENGAGREDIHFNDADLFENKTYIMYAGHEEFNLAPIYINGRVVGPDNEETVGVFGYHELVGAYGAKRAQ